MSLPGRPNYLSGARVTGGDLKEGRRMMTKIGNPNNLLKDRGHLGLCGNFVTSENYMFVPHIMLCNYLCADSLTLPEHQKSTCPRYAFSMGTFVCKVSQILHSILDCLRFCVCEKSDIICILCKPKVCKFPKKQHECEHVPLSSIPFFGNLQTSG